MSQEYISILNENLPEEKMSSIKVVLIILGVICIILLFLFGLFVYSLATLDSEQRVTGKVMLN